MYAPILVHGFTDEDETHAHGLWFHSTTHQQWIHYRNEDENTYIHAGTQNAACESRNSQCLTTDLDLANAIPLRPNIQACHTHIVHIATEARLYPYIIEDYGDEWASLETYLEEHEYDGAIYLSMHEDEGSLALYINLDKVTYEAQLTTALKTLETHSLTHQNAPLALDMSEHALRCRQVDS